MVGGSHSQRVEKMYLYLCISYQAQCNGKRLSLSESGECGMEVSVGRWPPPGEVVPWLLPYKLDHF